MFSQHTRERRLNPHAAFGYFLIGAAAQYKPLVPRGKRYIFKIRAVLVTQFSGERYGYGMACTGFPVKGLGNHYLCKFLMFYEIMVISKFIQQPQAYEDCHRHAQGKAQNVDRGVYLVFQQVTPSDFDKVFEHKEPVKRLKVGIYYKDTG